MDQVQGGRVDETALPPTINRGPMSEEEREEFRHVLARSYRIDLKEDPTAMTIEFEGEYIWYCLRHEDKTNGKISYLKKFRLRNLEGETGTTLARYNPAKAHMPKPATATQMASATPTSTPTPAAAVPKKISIPTAPRPKRKK